MARLVSLLVLALAFSAPVRAADLQPGTVDFAKVQRHYYRTEHERKALEARSAEEAKKLEEPVAKARSEAESLLKEQQDAQKQLDDPTRSEEKKKQIFAAAQERAAKINDLQRQVIELQAGARDLIARELNEASTALLQEIQDAIRMVAEEKGVDFVMNRSFGVNGIPTFPFVSAKNVVDLTDDVIGKLNKNAPADWKPGAEEPKPTAKPKG
jgi:Skp family chaperone for outer membrane proteins